VVKNEGQHAMVIQPPGFDELRTFGASQSPLVRFPTKSRESMKRVDELSQNRKIATEPRISIVQPMTQAGNEQKPGKQMTRWISSLKGLRITEVQCLYLIARAITRDRANINVGEFMQDTENGGQHVRERFVVEVIDLPD
jgi:hypothetical protein